jgi:heptaprenyl diphosphate synthase
MMPALLFNPNPQLRLAQFLFFWLLSWLSGAKNNPLVTILIILCITVFNLFVPYGRVLYTIGIVEITSGALVMGIQRAVTLEGLIMLSRFSVRRDIHIPGRFGEMIGESFRIYALLLDRKGQITWKNIIADIDRLMIELSEGEFGSKAEAAQNESSNASAFRTGLAGIAILTAAVVLAWLPWTIIIF